MKKLTVTMTMLAGTLVGLTAFAQGTVNFANVGVGLNQPIFASDGTTKLTTGFTVELMAGTSATTLGSVATTGFLASAPGYFAGGTVAIPTVGLGGTASIQVRVWSTASGSYAAALAANVVNTYGASSIFSVVTGGGGTPANPPASLLGLTSFHLNVIPEPSSFALAGLGAAALLVFRRRK